MLWPLYSLDINKVEHLWESLERCLKALVYFLWQMWHDFGRQHNVFAEKMYVGALNTVSHTWEQTCHVRKPVIGAFILDMDGFRGSGGILQ